MTAVPGYLSDLNHGPINDKDLGRLFGGGSTGHTRPLVSHMSREVLVGVQSINPDFLNFQESFYNDCTDKLPATDDPDTGLTTNGVFSTFDKGKCVSGWMANPMGYTPVSNEILRATAGLSNDRKHDFARIVKDLSSHLHSEWDECDINATPGSSAGWVGFRTELEWKLAFAEFTFEPKRFELYMKLALTDEVAFANEFETAFLFYSQKRDQIDAIGKERLAWGLLHARDPARYPDDKKIADKRVIINGVLWPHHSCTRARLVNAGPWAINCIIAPVAAGTMKSMFRRYPDVWHVNTATHIESLINGHYVWHGDASQFDQTHEEYALDAYHDGVRDHWKADIVDVAEKLLFAPYYARPLELEGEPAWIGVPFSGKREVICGNRSGHAWTSMYNKVLMVAAVLYALHLCGYKVIDNLHYWLSGQGIVKFINNGDDSIIYSKDKDALDRVIAKLTDLKTAIYKLEREKGGVYNGMPTILVDAAALTYKCVQNGMNRIMKILTPERPIYNPKNSTDLKRDLESGKKIWRKYWYLGFADAINNAHLDPTSNTIMGLFLEHWGKGMRSYLSISEMLDVARKKVPPLGGDLSQADMEVLDDPRKLHYKWTNDEISSRVLDQVAAKVPYSVFKHLVSTRFTGHLTPRS